MHNRKETVSKYLQNTLSDSKKKELEAWVSASKKNQALFEEMVRKFAETPNMSFDADQAFDSFQASVEKPKNKISKSIGRYAAIFIGIVGIAVLAGYFLLADHNKTPLSPEAAIILQAGDKTHRISVQNSTRFSNAQGQVWLTQKNDSLVFTENTHLLKPYHYISVPFGQTITLILPDKSVVQLNAGSSLIFENNFNTTSREVTLSGEGYFQIAHDKNKPFKVETNKTEIVVLGTRFNIQSYKEDKQIVTTLISGSISFSSSSGKELVLQPKEQLIYNKQDQTLEQLTVDTTSCIAWTQDKLVFNATPFPEIKTILQRKFNITIINKKEALNQAVFRGEFNKTHSITDILETISMSTPFAFKEEGNTIILY